MSKKYIAGTKFDKISEPLMPQINLSLTRDIRCKKCRKLLAKMSTDGKLVMVRGTQDYKNSNSIEIECRNKRCKEKNYIIINN